jgi:hypothetical protein
MSESFSPADTLHGSCLCGGVAYRAALPAECASHCYCTMCQKSHGAAAGTYLSVASAGFAIERGAGLVTDHASSATGRRSFCSVCGSSLYWRDTGEPQSIDLALGTLQPPWTGTVTRELHADTRPTWLPHR